MTNLMSRVGLYDLLSMVIPGYLTVFLLWKSFGNETLWPYDTLTYGITALCVSYIVGIAIHYIARFVFGWLRHNRWLNSAALAQFKNDLAAQENEESQSNNNELSQEWYNRTFYRLWKDDSLSHIPPLEAQFSFCRSLCVVGGLYVLFGWKFISFCWMISAIAIASIICFIIMIYTRNRIYYFYYEAEYYLINQNQRSNNNVTQTDNNAAINN